MEMTWIGKIYFPKFTKLHSNGKDMEFQSLGNIWPCQKYSDFYLQASRFMISHGYVCTCQKVFELTLKKCHDITIFMMKKYDIGLLKIVKK